MKHGFCNGSKEFLGSLNEKDIAVKELWLIVAKETVKPEVSFCHQL